MRSPCIAVPKFPGSNGEVDNLRALRRCGFDAFVFRWNDSREKLQGVDGYFFGAGFSYEDRGRAGMVAARDPLFEFIGKEAAAGKVVVGNCNGAQVLVESGLVPLGDGLRMSLARNAVQNANREMRNAKKWTAPGFLNQWVYITRTCGRDRCCTSDWDGVLQIPIAHGEGRFVTTDPDLIGLLEEHDQIAFYYCDASGRVSEDVAVNPNGSMRAIAGICNPAGNVVALMPHPERTVNGDPYFVSVKKWLEKKHEMRNAKCEVPLPTSHFPLPTRGPRPTEIFIDTIIVNNEERTVEQAAKRITSRLKLKQYRYVALTMQKAESVLGHISLFNPNKEVAYVRENPKSDLSLEAHRAKWEIRNPKWVRWNVGKKSLEPLDKNLLSPIALLRRDIPDTGAAGCGEGSETGVCYSLANISESGLSDPKLLEIFANPHASRLERLTPSD